MKIDSVLRRKKWLDRLLLSGGIAALVVVVGVGLYLGEFVQDLGRWPKFTLTVGAAILFWAGVVRGLGSKSWGNVADRKSIVFGLVAMAIAMTIAFALEG